MKILLSFLIIVLLISCSSTKKLSYEELMEGAPAWVKSGPNTQGFFHGVGMATKTGTPDDYREIARQNALSELASGISVTISSTSVLNQYEFDNNYSEYYRDNIKLTTQQYLEGYELVDNWENEQQYWVYFKLSKSKYKEIKQQRINKAVNASKADYYTARDFSKNGKVSDAMRFYVKSLEEVVDFLGEDLNIEQDGQKKEYSGLLLSEIIETVQNIRMIFSVEQVKLFRGIGPDMETVKVSVLDENNYPAKGIPVSVGFSYAPGKVDVLTSDASGEIRIKVDNFDSRRNDEYISCIVSINKIVKQNTSDPLVRRLLQSIKISEYVLPVEIISPKFLILTSEKNLGKKTTESKVMHDFLNQLENDGFEIVNNEESADFILISEVDTKKGDKVNGKYSAELSATFSLKNADEQVFYSEKLSGIMGIGSNYESAGDNAYRSLAGKIKINIYPAMYRKVFNAN